ncbi:hypothetical protein [Rhizobium oryzicola]|uniref:Uncharacterized protein n=1 Tax=Rhizobium oryzicola TaxID=1232668 RepID=A0ABT8SYV1_9HYPH|nr:hypothetical protein [Rhizobium oryzicola]MDO1583602.1 hypothetical protein [Rhizobium oryzicola]
MRDEIQFVYDELTNLGLIRASLREEVKPKIVALEQISPRDLFRFAFSLSIANMIRTSASFGFDEEHLTASLAGSLASNLTWFARAYRRFRGTRSLPQLRWIHQTKINEARSGIDLGFLFRVPGKDANRPYRLVLLQAKLASGKDMSISIDHVTNKRAANGTLQLSKDALTVLEAAASSNHPSGIVSHSLKNDAFAIAKKQFVRGTPRYQLETLLRTDLRGQSLNGKSVPWCFYVAWHAAALPKMIDAREIASTVLSRDASLPLSPVKIPATAPTLTEVVDRAMFEETPRYGLELPVKDLGGVMDYIVSAAPDIRILTNSVNPQLNLIFDRARGYRFSDSLIPADLLSLPKPAPKRLLEISEQESNDYHEELGTDFSAETEVDNESDSVTFNIT